MISSKRIKIKVPQRVELTANNFEEAWSTLEIVFDKVFNDNTQDISFEKTYRLVYDLVRYKRETELYNRLKDYLIKKLGLLRKKRFDEKTIKNWDFLTTLAKCWTDSNRYLKSIKDLTLYLDRTYCNRNRVPNIIETGLIIFNDNVLIPLKERLNEEFIFGVTDLRIKYTYEDPHTKILKELMSMMETILCEEDNFFITHIQGTLLKETEKYYSQVIKSLDLQPMDGFNKVKKLISFERSLDMTFLNQDSQTKIEKSIESVLIWENFDKMLAPLSETALAGFNEPLLRELYYLTSDRKYKLKLKHVIQESILKNLSQIKPDESEKKKSLMGTTWVCLIIQTFSKYENLLRRFEFEVDDDSGKDNFQTSNESNNLDHEDEGMFGSIIDDNNDENANRDTATYKYVSSKQTAVSLLNETFSIFFNINGKQTIQFICFYLDNCLKRTQEKTEINNARKDLSECIKLIKLLSEKDEFTMIYKNQLSKRLLQQRSSLDTERFVVKKISDELGSFFTYKLETMLRDVTSSSDMARNFKTSQNDKNDSNSTDHIGFVPEILTMTSWPFQNIHDIVIEDITLPDELEALKLQFETFYNKKYNERRLKWAHSLGLLEIGFQFDKTYHNLIMPVYAGIILLLFEDHDELTTEMISEMTSIPEQELNRQLLSLTMSPKSRILKKSPATKMISKLDKFSINYGFTSPLEKIKVQTIVGNIPSLKSDNGNSDPLERERVIMTNAAIVRVMKAEKVLTHNNLFDTVSESVKQTFKLPTAVFKKSLSYLISKEYVQRDIDDPSLYHYLS